MSILHYTIGIPPERNGGSIQYAYGLMHEQAKTEKIYTLICGDTLFRGSKCKIIRIGKIDKIELFKLSNPLTPTLIYGVNNPESQYRDINIDYKNIRDFIQRNDIKILHMHTLMGMHKDVLSFIKNLGVKIIYTSHDFHGICPHYNFIDYNGNLCENINPTICAICNSHEPSDLFLRFVNSNLYRFIKKNYNIFRFKRSKILNHKIAQNNKTHILPEKIKKFETLVNYYMDYFKLIDKFHFNSEQTRTVFKKYIPYIDGRVIPVITSGIKDNRRLIKLSDIVKLGFIGNSNDYKGFPLLKEIAMELYNEGVRNLKILAYTECKIGIDSECPLIEYQPPYKYKDISKILYHLDGTIVPSKCYETFSLVTLESLSHGRPAIVSDHVGAKDIVASYNKDLIFSSSQQLKILLLKISNNPDFLVSESNRIVSSQWNYSIENHANEIISYYYE